MVDTNVLIYFLTNIDVKEKEQIKNLFKLENKFQFVITTRILDELIFKLIIIQSGKNIRSLKKNKDLLKKYSYTISWINKFLKDFNFKNYEIKEKHYWKLQEIIEKYGLIGNDALTLMVIKENNLKYIATLDKDFNIENLPVKNILKLIN